MVALTYPNAKFLIILAGFVLLWCVISYTVAMLGGWQTLAQRWRATEAFAGPKHYFCSGQMRWWIGYRSALTLGSNMHGLHMSVMAPFRLGHPPLFIPWTTVRIVPDRKGIFFKQKGLMLDEQANITLWLFEGTARQLLAQQTQLSAPAS